ncbi:FAD-binding oxidoreductase, partial [Schleiferia thermophila]
MKKLRKAGFAGEIYTDLLRKSLYATDASIYREYPIAVTYPTGERDVQILINLCREYSLPIIPRAAGTSLAGQCV